MDDKLGRGHSHYWESMEAKVKGLTLKGDTKVKC